MKNIKLKIEQDTLYLEVDLSADCGLSKSGQSHIVASSLGNVRLFDQDRGEFRMERLNFTVSRPVEAE